MAIRNEVKLVSRQRGLSVSGCDMKVGGSGPYPVKPA